MNRKLQPDGICTCCGHVGATWMNVGPFVPMDLGIAGMAPLETDTSLPPLCDRCEQAQRRWDGWQYQLTHPGAVYPFTEGPPKTPPVKRDV